MSTDDGDHTNELRRQIGKLLRLGVTVKSIKQSMEDDPQGPVAKAIHETIVEAMNNGDEEVLEYLRHEGWLPDMKQ